MNSTVVSVAQLNKEYGSLKAVDDLTFDVTRGEIFGLLGPNGAGKTTTIRILLNLLAATSGEVSVLDGPMSESKKEKIGYLPEERGLYSDMTLQDMLVFLARLKGLSKREALDETNLYLQKLDLFSARTKKIDALSRGMRQKAQFIASVVHNPELLIVDEPFSGLDPVNTRLIKSLLYELRECGTTIIMSTHQMAQVEEMCERILLMDHGRQVIYGPLNEIRESYGSNAILVWVRGKVQKPDGVETIEEENGALKMTLSEGIRPEDILSKLASTKDVHIQKYERALPTLDEIFILAVTNNRKHAT